MTATSGARSATGGQQKARAVRGLALPNEGPNRSDREGRSAAAATRGVGVFEREPRLLEVAPEVDRRTVEVLGAEGIDEAAHAARFHDDIVVERLRFDVEAVAETRAPARQHRDPEAGRLGGGVLLRHELPHFRSEEHTSELQSRLHLV